MAWMKALARPVRDATAARRPLPGPRDCHCSMEILAAEDWLALGEFLSSLPADVDQQTLKDQPLVHQLLAGELAWTLATRLAPGPVFPSPGKKRPGSDLPWSEPDPGSPGHVAGGAFSLASARCWPAGPAAGRWPRGCRVAAWGPGPNNGISGSCGMPCGVLVLTAGRCWRRMTIWGQTGSDGNLRSGIRGDANCSKPC